MINTISTKAMEQHFNERQYAEGGGIYSQGTSSNPSSI